MVGPLAPLRIYDFYEDLPAVFMPGAIFQYVSQLGVKGVFVIGSLTPFWALGVRPVFTLREIDEYMPGEAVGRRTLKMMSMAINDTEIPCRLRALNNDSKRDFLRDEALNNNGPGAITCEICHRMVGVVNEHHHPVTRKNGGQNTIQVCPTCHAYMHTDLYLIEVKSSVWDSEEAQEYTRYCERKSRR